MTNVLLGIIPTNGGLEVFENPEYSTDDNEATFCNFSRIATGTNEAIWDLGSKLFIDYIRFYETLIQSNGYITSWVKFFYSPDGIIWNLIWDYTNFPEESINREDHIHDDARYFKVTLRVGLVGTTPPVFASHEMRAYPPWSTTTMVVEDTSDEYIEDSWQVKLFNNKLNPFKISL